MIGSTTRPLTRNEKAVLRAYLRRGASGIGERLFAAIMVFSILTVALCVAWEMGQSRFAIGDHYENLIVAMLVALAIAVSIWVFVRGGRSKASVAKLFHEDLKNGQALVYSFIAGDAISVEETEDNGPTFYLDTGSGQVLFLMGQYLADLVKNDEFPSRRFEVSYGPSSRLVLDVIPKGEHLSPSVTLPAFTKADVMASRIPDDGATLEVDFASLKHRTAHT